MEKKNLESFTANEFSTLEMAEIKGGREVTEGEDGIGFNCDCNTYSANCIVGCACQPKLEEL